MAGELEWLNPTDTSRQSPPSKAALLDGIRIGFAPAPQYFGWHVPWEPIARRNSNVAIRDGRAMPSTAPEVAAPRYFGWFSAWPLTGRPVRTNRSGSSPIFGVAAMTTGRSAPADHGGTVTVVFDGLVAKRVTGAATNTVQIRGRPTT